MNTNSHQIEKTLKSYNISQFCNRDERKDLLKYNKEIPIGRVKALLSRQQFENDNTKEELIKIKSVGLMICPFAILIPQKFFEEQSNNYNKIISNIAKEVVIDKT